MALPRFRATADLRAYFAAATNYERTPGVPYTRRTYNLGRMKRLLAALGHPQRRLKILHIAGTKGKGSVAHMAEALLRRAGFRTGLFTSPHLLDMRERVRLDGRPMSRRDFLDAMNVLAPHLHLRPTYFEILTAVAIVLFERVDWAILEVGLGGRLDATTACRPVACAITRIDFDHMDKLGRTLTAIAGEKAGILKRDVPCVVAPQPPEARREILRRARKVGAPLTHVKLGRFRLPVLGAHQHENASTATALLRAAGVSVKPDFSLLKLPARIQRLGRVIVDGAHNPVSARALAATLRTLPGRKTLVFAAPSDKDVTAMLAALAPVVDDVVCTRYDHPRAVDPRILAALVRGVPVRVAPRLADALQYALGNRGHRWTVVAGSFYLAGEALRFLSRHGQPEAGQV